MDELNTVNGKLRFMGIIGDPVAQAKSPMLINTALRERQIPDTLLIPLHVGSAGLTDAINGLKACRNFCGAIVTMPHKRHVLPLLDTVSDTARAIGACNVFKRGPDGRLSGTMMDGEGFVAGLQKRGYDVQGKSVYLAGAGGAAAAIAFAVAAHGARRLVIYNRTVGKASALCKQLQSLYPAVSIETGSEFPRDVDIAINGTSVGMGNDPALPFSLRHLDLATVICDIVVFPELTPLLANADQIGFPVHYGKEMIMAQVPLLIDFMLN
ncbi:shikimate dehydrogenase [Acerihabitans sp.]|uniref:shikimate dehydrogenase family protein n=1 Tax=Acerihabitans sp. TaxID=2811394 RepID=UPI002EDB2FF4